MQKVMKRIVKRFVFDMERDVENRDGKWFYSKSSRSLVVLTIFNKTSMFKRILIFMCSHHSRWTWWIETRHIKFPLRNSKPTATKEKTHQICWDKSAKTRDKIGFPYSTTKEGSSKNEPRCIGGPSGRTGTDHPE